MVDPISIIAISSAVGDAVGGATGKLFEKACDSTMRWLSTYFRDHQPNAIAAAQINSLDFLAQLAHRVQALEAEATDAAARRRITDALDDPDFAATFKDALIASARTSDSEKHDMLSRLVAERLRQPPETIVALAIPLATQAVSRLTSRQMKLLGLATFVKHIRPRLIPPPIPPDDFPRWYDEWLTTGIQPFAPLESVHQPDLFHMEALSCVQRSVVGHFVLERELTPKVEQPYAWDYHHFITETPLGPSLNECWESGLKLIMLTSIGQLIGAIVKDRLTGSSTEIDWEPHIAALNQ